jgi:hypothetical protein
MNRPLILGALGALLAVAPAGAMQTPEPGKQDKRVRVIDYDPEQVVQLSAAPGETVRIAIAPDEKVEALLVSDQSVMSGDLEVDSGAGDPSPRSQPSADPKSICAPSCDANLCRSVCGPFIYIEPVRPLDPQPLHIQTSRRCVPVPEGQQLKCEWRTYQFELLTRNGPLTEAQNTLYSVRFNYPADRAAAEAARARAAAAARRAAAAARLQEAREKAAEDLLRAQQAAVVNKSYTVRGDRGVLGAARGSASPTAE